MADITHASVSMPRGVANILNLVVSWLTSITTLINQARTLLVELTADHGTFRTAGANLKTALGNICLTDVGSAIGSTKQKAKTAAAATYLIGGAFKTKNATDNLWTLTGFDCENGNYNKCLLCLDADGAAQIAAGTEAAAAADVVLPALPAAYAVVAMVQVHPDGTGDFTGGTTALDDGTVSPNATFTDLAFHPDTIGDVPAALSASISASAVSATLTAGK